MKGTKDIVEACHPDDHVNDIGVGGDGDRV
jgi:hypothetical protein